MSLSTTSTATYTLTKYSRAYPSSTGAAESEVEWQHFTNPVIRLTLDIKKKADGELESYRVRVVWSLNPAGPHSMEIDQREVVFEDLDLLSFSPSPATNGHNFTVHGLPLKAIYRDSVLGIRYMHPRIVPAGASPSYRRFQVNFINIADVNNFVDAIKHVCPCKTNAPPTPAGPTRSMTMSTSTSNRMLPPNMPSQSAQSNLRHSVTMKVSQAHVARTSTIAYGSNLSATNPPDLSQDSMYGPTTQSQVTFPAPSASVSVSGSNSPTRPASSLSSLCVGTILEQTPTLSLVDTAEHHQIPSGAENQSGQSRTRGDLAASAHPSDTPPSSQRSSSWMDTVLGPTSERSNLTSSSPPQSLAASSKNQNHIDLISELRAVPPLYNLPQPDLEKLVAQVVREDGFAELLERLDSMWKVKAAVRVQ